MAQGRELLKQAAPKPCKCGAPSALLQGEHHHGRLRDILEYNRSLPAILLIPNLTFVDPYGDWQGSRSGFWPAHHPGDWGYKISFLTGQILLGAKLFNFHQAADELLEGLLTRSYDVQLVSCISSMH